jgi:hypothetical protein
MSNILCPTCALHLAQLAIKMLGQIGIKVYRREGGGGGGDVKTKAVMAPLHIHFPKYLIVFCFKMTFWLKVCLHVRFQCPILMSDAIWTGIILLKLFRIVISKIVANSIFNNYGGCKIIIWRQTKQPNFVHDYTQSNHIVLQNQIVKSLM